MPQQLNSYSFNTNEINYLYNAAGIKLRKQTRIDFAVEKTMDYIGNFVYEDNELKYILTGEGRIMVNDGSTYEYQYFLKDHLGNTRVTFNENGDIIQDDAYYPFGMQINGLCYETGEDYKNKYLYNGKELQDDFGLDWYDYEARFYDAQIGMWHVVDAMAENHYDFTPYNYVLNNPLLFIDPIGLDTVWVFDQANNPNDRSQYTATIYHEKNEHINDPVEGSSYPNHPDTESGNQNTVDAGTHSFNNESGHSNSSEKGLNLVNSDGDRVSPGTKPDGTAIDEMTGVNIHEGDSENNRGSAGCPTVQPAHANRFFGNFGLER